MLKGSCHCRAVTWESDGPVVRFSNCHCDDCRKITGSAYGTALVLPAPSFRIVEGEDQLTPYESSAGKFRSFCRTCGAHVVARMVLKPEIVIVRAGSLDVDPGVRPQMHIWVRAKAPWYEICDNLPRHEEGPPIR